MPTCLLARSVDDWFVAAARMKYLLCIVVIAIIFGALRTHRQVRESRDSRERAFIIRTAMACVLFTIVCTALLLFLPNKARILMLIPAFFVAVTLGRAWYNTRARLRREAAGRVDFERMKRVGSP